MPICCFITGHTKCEYISSYKIAVSVQYSNPLPTAGVHLQKITAVGKNREKKDLCLMVNGMETITAVNMNQRLGQF
jgi:hypothetical protein